MLREITILYVEDDKETNDAITDILREFAKNVVNTYDSSEALDIFKEIKPDLVITDIQMPNINGFELIENIKSIKPEQPTVIISAFNDPEYLKKAISLGVSGYILKPIDEKPMFLELNRVAENIVIKKRQRYDRKYLEKIFETTPNFIITTYGDRLERANDSFFEFFGYESKEAFLEDYDCVCDFFEEEEGFVQKNMGEENWMEHILKNPKKYHKVKIKKDGNDYIYGISAKKFEFNETHQYIVILTNITQLELQTKKILDQEEMLMFQSKQATMGELIGLIAHQWKQPLNLISLIASSQLTKIDFEDEIPNSVITTDANDILKQVDYLSTTIDNFRDFLKPNRLPLSENISKVLDDTLMIVGKSLSNNNISIKTDIQKDVQLHTFTKELSQIMINIINNSKDAFLERNIDNKQIDVVIFFEESRSDQLCIDFTDNAGGIPTEILPKIYDPYFTTKSADKGTGIGLYMVKNLVQKHLKGEIEMINYQEGVKTSISIPVDVRAVP